MSKVGQREILTQRCVVAFFKDALDYTYLGHWKDRADNGNIENALLTDWLKRQGDDDKIITKVSRELSKAAALGGSKTLYDANREVYDRLRYGVKVRPDVGEQNVTVWLIDWTNPGNNDFAIAEEVTVAGENTKRPDLVLYVNGIAFGVLELKRSTVSVTEGIRQNLDSQKKEFIQPFFATVQLVMAGNDTEGLRYGMIETPEKYWLRWKEAEAHPDAVDNPLLRELSQLCSKTRLIEIVHDFIVFDAGVKKICRHNQYFGVRAAQKRVQRRVGGIIWHTQGSGKSLTMVWLAKWIREHVTGGRVLIITDRTELDEQIEKVFKGVSENIYRTTSGADLVHVLNAGDEWLIGSLIHKFGAAEEGDVDQFVEDIRSHLPKDFHAKGEIFVFVDECHRTQSGKLHDAMKGLLPGVMLIGFTGTPLLKDDKRRSIETFGPYIHTYKYDEAVSDGVVLDLRYEARDIDQNITSQARIDEWFDNKTRGLTDVAKAQLKQRWGTMQRILSARNRLEKIVADILLDMETRDRLKSGRGNAILVSGSIHSACRFFEMFRQTNLAGKCAIVTSYRPATADIKGEETGEGHTEKLRQYDVYRKMIAAHFNEPEESAVRKVEQFEKEVKKRFIEQPGQMKLLIVVDKLLTGFDAPSATYLYIDKQMKDHGLFQAICRVNRLDGDDKEYGYVIDYKDLFRSLEQSIKDYTGEAFNGYDTADVKGLLKDRLKQGRERLEETREGVKALCEPVEPPRDITAYLHFFCAVESGDAHQLRDNEPKRVALYKLAAAFLRAYANLANEMREAGYSDAEAQEIKAEVDHYEKVRQEVKLASGDYIDLKVYEPAMRHLLDTYIRAEESERLSTFDDLTLVQLIVERGQDALDVLPGSIRKSSEAVAETIENNVRRLIIDETAVNPKYYEKMSELLDALIRRRKREALDYKRYLAELVELTRKVSSPETQLSYPSSINSAALRALFDNLEEPQASAVREPPPPHYGTKPAVTTRETTALALDSEIRRVKKADWRGNTFKEREVRNAIRSQLRGNEELANTMFEIVKNQRDY
ncbi:MAG: type I restriction endonuclease subunit R [Nitrospira sp. SB0667_bin_9]|nr:type I restriction endonuclease subunit R [Nitrospira sp. SB0667_bin_9]MYD31394.1 type I restriction endonuclease subunit R [Nitrospira sp. SB0661_bin_20]MYJ23857.1 type I restriction endonuclease subunit R [Nitrospira sp. SB0673_bin_12]